MNHLELPYDRSMLLISLQEVLGSDLYRAQKRASTRIISEKQLSVFVNRIVSEIMKNRAGYGVLSGGRIPRKSPVVGKSTLVTVIWWRYSQAICIAYRIERVSGKDHRHPTHNGEFYINPSICVDDLEYCMLKAAPGRYYRLIRITDMRLRKRFADWSEIPREVKLRRIYRCYPRAAILKLWCVPPNRDDRWLLVTRGIPIRTMLFYSCPSVAQIAEHTNHSPETIKELFKAKNDKEVIAAVLAERGR